MLNYIHFSELNDKKKQSILVVINFGGETERIDIKKALTDLPDLMKIEIIGGDSKFTKHQQISISGQIELQKYESIVAFYNSSSTLFISKTAFIFLIVICLCINSKL